MVIIRCFRVSAFVLRLYLPRLCKVGNEGGINTVFKLLANKVCNFFVCIRNYKSNKAAYYYLFIQFTYKQNFSDVQFIYVFCYYQWQVDF